MKRRLFYQLVIPAAAFASIVALLAGERQTISLQIWLAVFMSGAAITALLRLFEHAPSVPLDKLLIAAHVSDVTPLTSSPAKRARVIEGLVLRSRDNRRAFEQQLQPELIELADHFLGVNHGVDTERNPDRTRSILGDLHWLIQPPSDGRTPTVDELARFVDIIINDDKQRMP